MHARLVTVGTVYHQRPGRQPAQVGIRWVRQMASDEQPVSREIVIGEAWQPIEAGWLKDVGYLVLANEEGKWTQTIPTEQEKIAAAGKVVEVGMVGYEGDPVRRTCFLVLPGETLPCTPSCLSLLCLRCRTGQARCTLTLYPG